MNWYVIVAVVEVLLWLICPPTVLYWPLKLMPVVRWMIIVTDNVVSGPVLLICNASSLNQGLLALTMGVTVTPPFPPPVFTVRLIVVVLVSPPPVPVTVTPTDPVTALLEALNVNVLLVPVADCGLNTAVTPLGRPLAVNATLLLKRYNEMPALCEKLADRYKGKVEELIVLSMLYSSHRFADLPGAAARTLSRMEEVFAKLGPDAFPGGSEEYTREYWVKTWFEPLRRK